MLRTHPGKPWPCHFPRMFLHCQRKLACQKGNSSDLLEELWTRDVLRLHHYQTLSPRSLSSLESHPRTSQVVSNRERKPLVTWTSVTLKSYFKRQSFAQCIVGPLGNRRSPCWFIKLKTSSYSSDGCGITAQDVLWRMSSCACILWKEISKENRNKFWNSD